MYINIINFNLGNTDDIEIALTDFKQANEIPLEKVCRLKRAERIETPTGDHSIPTYFFNNFEDIQQYQPFVTVLRFEAFDMDVIPQILLYTKIYSFSQIWKKTGREVKKNKGKKLRINEIILEVWKPSYTFWNSICYKLKTGDLLFTEFEDYFYQEETEIAEILRKEIAYSSTRGDTQWIQIRLDQFQNHKMIFDCLKGAKAIMAIVHTYDLKGDFSHVNEIINMVSCFYSFKIKQNSFTIAAKYQFIYGLKACVFFVNHHIKIRFLNRRKQ